MPRKRSVVKVNREETQRTTKEKQIKFIRILAQQRVKKALELYISLVQAEFTIIKRTPVFELTKKSDSSKKEIES